MSKMTNRSKRDFDKIDEINNKVCGLIKSISSSCHKKASIDIKNNRNDRESSKKAHLTASKAATNLDYQKT
jgi:hypothetical protein